MNFGYSLIAVVGALTLTASHLAEVDTHGLRRIVLITCSQCTISAHPQLNTSPFADNAIHETRLPKSGNGDCVLAKRYCYTWYCPYMVLLYMADGGTAVDLMEAGGRVPRDIVLLVMV
jgi:hypothetical protein